jgi:hypothetical protein
LNFIEGPPQIAKCEMLKYLIITQVGGWWGQEKWGMNFEHPILVMLKFQ